MITLPPEFVETKFPGYYWNTKTQQLFSLKVTGVLRPLAKPKISKFNRYQDVYQVSVMGKKRYLYMHNLRALKAKAQMSLFPVQASD